MSKWDPWVSSLVVSLEAIAICTFPEWLYTVHNSNIGVTTRLEILMMGFIVQVQMLTFELAIELEVYYMPVEYLWYSLNKLCFDFCFNFS